MKFTKLIFPLTLMVISSSAFAQNAAQEEDVVIGTAIKQTDPAMSAFLSGDYATAEIEFDRNAFCALRAERNFRSGVEDARDSTIRADVNVEADIGAQPTGGPGASGGLTIQTAPTVAPNASVNSSDFQRNESKNKRTCETRGYQVYMKGMSQLKLGKTAEAKETLYKATKIHRTIYDAHFRLSLMEYQDGNIEKAKSEFKKLKKIAKRCLRCDAKPEIDSQVQYLDNLLK